MLSNITMTLLHRLSETRRSRAMIGVTLLVLAGLCLVVGVWTAPGRWVDGQAYGLVLNIVPAGARRVLDRLARPLAPVAMVPVAAVLALIGLWRHRWADVLAAVILSGTIPLAYWLRADVISKWDVTLGGHGASTFPSTHAAAGFALLAAILILWPVPLRRRVLVAAGIMALLIGVGNVAWYAHRPVDVAGSACLVTGCAALLLTARPADRRAVE